MNKDSTQEFTDFMDQFLAAHPEVVEDQRRGWEIYWSPPRADGLPLGDLVPERATCPAKAEGPAIDPDGFLADAAGWSVETARQLAMLDGLGGLDECQIALLQALRDHYSRLGAVPAIPHVCHMVGLESDCMSRRFHGAREAWRLAGLPNPGEEAKAYL